MNFITPEQVVELLKVDLDTVLLWLKQKKLPQPAYKLRPWWANDFSHSQARSWLRAGWETRGLDLVNRCVMFVRRG